MYYRHKLNSEENKEKCLKYMNKVLSLNPKIGEVHLDLYRFYTRFNIKYK